MARSSFKACISTYIYISSQYFGPSSLDDLSSQVSFSMFSIPLPYATPMRYFARNVPPMYNHYPYHPFHSPSASISLIYLSQVSTTPE